MILRWLYRLFIEFSALCGAFIGGGLVFLACAHLRDFIDALTPEGGHEIWGWFMLESIAKFAIYPIGFVLIIQVSIVVWIRFRGFLFENS